MSDWPHVQQPRDVPEDMLGFDAPYNPPAFPPPSYLRKMKDDAPAAPAPERDVPPNAATGAEAPGMTPLVIPPVYERKSGQSGVRVPVRAQAVPNLGAGPGQAHAAPGRVNADFGMPTSVANPPGPQQRQGAPLSPPDFANRPAMSPNDRAPNTKVPDVRAEKVRVPDHRAPQAPGAQPRSARGNGGDGSLRRPMTPIVTPPVAGGRFETTVEAVAPPARTAPSVPHSPAPRPAPGQVPERAGRHGVEFRPPVNGVAARPVDRHVPRAPAGSPAPRAPIGQHPPGQHPPCRAPLDPAQFQPEDNRPRGAAGVAVRGAVPASARAPAPRTPVPGVQGLEPMAVVWQIVDYASAHWDVRGFTLEADGALTREPGHGRALDLTLLIGDDGTRIEMRVQVKQDNAG